MYVAPDHAPAPDVFLAGGISGTDDWQATAGTALASQGLQVANPRRPGMFNDPGLEPDQVRWEADHLSRSSVILFWFPGPGDHPIAMYELGRWAATGRRLVVGCADTYPRRTNLITQMELVRPGLPVHNRLTDVIATTIREVP